MCRINDKIHLTQQPVLVLYNIVSTISTKKLDFKLTDFLKGFGITLVSQGEI